MTSSSKGNEVAGFRAETKSRRGEVWLDRPDSWSAVKPPSKKRIWEGWCGSAAGADGIRLVSVATGMEGASGHVHGVKMYLCGDFAFGEWRAGVDAVGQGGSPGQKEVAMNNRYIDQSSFGGDLDTSRGTASDIGVTGRWDGELEHAVPREWFSNCDGAGALRRGLARVFGLRGE